jgi:hypothetical protein
VLLLMVASSVELIDVALANKKVRVSHMSAAEVSIAAA